MKQIVSDPHTYVGHKVIKGKPCILVIPAYVDDKIPMGDKELVNDFESWIGKDLEVSFLGDTSHFIGIRII